jgi:hypothetical protein
MIRIKRVELPAGMQVFARRQNDVVVVYVSAGLSAAGRAAAIRRALRAAPEAGWRSSRRPVLLPALAGAVRLRRVPESRWTYRAVFAAAAAVVIVVVAMAAAMALSRPPLGPDPGSRPEALAPGPSAGGPADPAVGPGSSARGSSGPAPGGHGRQGAKASKSGTAVQPGTPGASGSGPAPQTSGKPVPVATTTPTSAPSPRPRPSSKPSPSPSPSPAKTSGGGSPPGCVTLLGVGICL